MRWHFCNVLDAGANARRVWQFDARTDAFNLNRELTARNGEQLPPNIVAKSWSSLFQRKLNVAWLPAENVFLRVAQFPMSTPEETRSMVDLQLEKDAASFAPNGSAAIASVIWVCCASHAASRAGFAK